jgi:hypothetical protein
MITDFPEFENESMGGNISFQFIPINNTQSISDAVSCAVAALPTPKGGKSILDGLAILGTLSFIEKMDETAAGHYYKTEIKGFVPYLSAAYLALFNEMKQARHIVMPTDSNGKVRVCGTLTNGMKFTFDQDTKEAASGANGFSFMFSGQFTEPSPFLVVS